MNRQAGWDSAAAVPSVGRGGGDVTLVEGQTFCLSTRSGDMFPDLPQGLFVLDTRILSKFEMRLNGHRVETLVVSVQEPFSATYVCRGLPASGAADSDLVVMRFRHIGNGMRERLVITNHAQSAARVSVELRCDADFADLFEVKEERVRLRGRYSQEAQEQALLFEHRSLQGRTKQVEIGFSEPGALEPTRATFERVVAPKSSWEICVQVTVALDGRPVEPLFKCGQSDEVGTPGRRLATWRARLPTLETDDPALAAAVATSGQDLGALRIFDPEYPDVPILAAGAPWFMTVFGRDSLLTGWMTMPADPSLARGVLETLARFQGTRVDPDTEEEPGKILHEMRFGGAGGLALGGGDIYYGAIDATPLFVMLLGEARRWGADDEWIERLLPHADRALQWIEDYGDRDGDGYVEYLRQSADGLTNQGWKDSWDGIRFAGGDLAEPPIALCEVQGYVYAAYLARAHFAQEAGDRQVCEHYRAKAATLRRHFNEDFWMPDQGTYALGLDAGKRQIDSVTSNVGHCLWTGIVDADRVAAVADRLMSDDMFTGWGVRTLAASMAAYNPVSYHNGSVWPHDNALCAAGLARYGLIDAAHRIIEGQIQASLQDGGRIPELFAGFSRSEVSVPAAYPASCSPQAWGASAPISWLRTLLRLDPWVSRQRLWVAPSLPPSMHRLRVEGIQVGDRSITVDVDGQQVSVAGADPLEVIRAARAPLGATDDMCSGG
ncbi:MAG: glycogen debranching N-terminal domain-containing protein [Actinomycetota bacterium]